MNRIFLAKDKKDHFLIGVTAATLLLILGISPSIVFLAVTVLGVAKEIYDHFNTLYRADTFDALATVLGGAFQIAFYLILVSG